jgi:hypothetical protein
LIPCQPSEGDLDPHHLHAGLPLTVYAVLQSKRLENIVGEISSQHTLSFGFECLNFLSDMSWDGLGFDRRTETHAVRTHGYDLVDWG